MDGVLELIAESREGRTFLSHRRASPPFFVSKPYERGSALEVQLQQVGPGFFGGDESNVRIEVRAGASLMLSTPSAARLLPRQHQRSFLRQEILVRAGARLEYWPEPLYPHGGSGFLQETTLRVEPGGTLFWLETLAPGRDASGERYLWENLDMTTSLWEGERLLLRERLRASGSEWRELARAFPQMEAWTGTLIACNPSPEWRDALKNLPRSGALVGWSEPEPQLAIVKFMAKDGHEVRILREALKPQVALRQRRYADREAIAD